MSSDAHAELAQLAEQHQVLCIIAGHVRDEHLARFVLPALAAGEEA